MSGGGGFFLQLVRGSGRTFLFNCRHIHFLFFGHGKGKPWKGVKRMNPSSKSGLTAKELSYITDSMKNEELLTKLYVQGAVESTKPELKQVMDRHARERLKQVEQLNGLFSTFGAQSPSNQ
ncbi:hypothetical protein P7H09_10110 [Paenibacillus larvae]|uniref:Spore coat protein n=3 Tax=Paenibacillus larvae TaxID=1464 RepID=A0AAP5JTG9_9BACL|nr:hypothetical protein [Paenibacillus larvae]PCK70947.1 hypothetical protein PL1_1004 [Paenibacillus larvae subsp. larvae B-3650]